MQTTIQSSGDAVRLADDEARTVGAWLRIRGSSIEGAAYRVTCQRCGNWLRGNDLTELLYWAIHVHRWRLATSGAVLPSTPCDEMEWVCPGEHRDAQIVRGAQ